jgi:hypothetical protein
MKYLPQLLIFLLWPVFIYLCYKICAWVIDKFERKLEKNRENE